MHMSGSSQGEGAGTHRSWHTRASISRSPPSPRQQSSHTGEHSLSMGHGSATSQSYSPRSPRYGELNHAALPSATRPALGHSTYGSVNTTTGEGLASSMSVPKAAGGVTTQTQEAKPSQKESLARLAAIRARGRAAFAAHVARSPTAAAQGAADFGRIAKQRLRSVSPENSRSSTSRSPSASPRLSPGGRVGTAGYDSYRRLLHGGTQDIAAPSQGQASSESVAAEVSFSPAAVQNKGQASVFSRSSSDDRHAASHYRTFDRHADIGGRSAVSALQKPVQSTVLDGSYNLARNTSSVSVASGMRHELPGNGGSMHSSAHWVSHEGRQGHVEDGSSSSPYHESRSGELQKVLDQWADDDNGGLTSSSLAEFAKQEQELNGNRDVLSEACRSLHELAMRMRPFNDAYSSPRD